MKLPTLLVYRRYPLFALEFLRALFVDMQELHCMACACRIEGSWSYAGYVRLVFILRRGNESNDLSLDLRPLMREMHAFLTLDMTRDRRKISFNAPWKIQSTNKSNLPVS